MFICYIFLNSNNIVYNVQQTAMKEFDSNPDVAERFCINHGVQRGFFNLKPS